MIARSLLDQSTAAELKIFYSYARQDESWRRELDRVLPEFQWEVAVRTWYDGDIEPGSEWAGEIDRNLAAADLILLFVGQSFIDSDYCREVELPAAMRRHRDGEARVVPIILETTTPDWRGLDFGRLQCLPQNGVPLSDWDDRPQALRDVAQGLVELVLRHGLRPATRMRWELHLEGDTTAFSADDRNATAVELRRATADQSLRCVSVRQGSIVLTMESSQDAMTWMTRAFDVGDLRTLLGRPIRKILRLFGASVQAISTGRASEPRDAPPGDRMLLPSRKFAPAQIECLIVDPDEPLARLDSLIYIGDPGSPEAAESTAKLMDFVRTALAVAETDLYVNLAPNESAKLLPRSLTGTRMGVGLLELDYRLKRLAASLLHPDLETGRQFWAEVTDRCREESGKRDEPLEIPAFHRVWIVPGQAEVYVESSFAEFERRLGLASTPRPANAKDRPYAYVLRQSVKALTVGEYDAARSAGATDRVTTICDEVFRAIVLPVIQGEIDEGESFAELRQIYQCILLAIWFKRNFGSHPAVAEYIDSGHPEWLRVNIGEIEHLRKMSPGPSSAMPPASTQATAAGAARIRALPEYNLPENREYFERYMDVFDTGVFSLQRHELIEGTSLTRARAYFAGAIDFRQTRDAMRHV